MRREEPHFDYTICLCFYGLDEWTYNVHSHHQIRELIILSLLDVSLSYGNVKFVIYKM